MRPGWSIIPGDWANLERIINELGWYRLAEDSQTVSQVSSRALVLESEVSQVEARALVLESEMSQVQSELSLTSIAVSSVESRVLVLESEMSEVQSVVLKGDYDSNYETLLVERGI